MRTILRLNIAYDPTAANKIDPSAAPRKFLAVSGNLIFVLPDIQSED